MSKVRGATLAKGAAKPEEMMLLVMVLMAKKKMAMVMALIMTNYKEAAMAGMRTK